MTGVACEGEDVGNEEAEDVRGRGAKMTEEE